MTEGRYEGRNVEKSCLLSRCSPQYERPELALRTEYRWHPLKRYGTSSVQRRGKCRALMIHVVSPVRSTTLTDGFRNSASSCLSVQLVGPLWVRSTPSSLLSNWPTDSRAGVTAASAASDAQAACCFISAPRQRVCDGRSSSTTYRSIEVCCRIGWPRRSFGVVLATSFALWSATTMRLCFSRSVFGVGR